MEAELTEVEGVKYLAVPPDAKIIVIVADRSVSPDMFEPSEEEMEALDRTGIETMPVFFVDDTSDIRMFRVECPVCRMFLDATQGEPDAKTS